MCIRDRLYLVRHGESECNVQRRLYGRTDCSLTEKGCRQAREVGEKLRDEKIDLCISSPPVSYTHLDVYKRQALHRRYGG